MPVSLRASRRAILSPSACSAAVLSPIPGLIAPGAPVLVGVSGGMDSAVLLDVLLRAGHPVEVVHVDYGLRGAESDADAAFVADLCARRGVPLHLRRVTDADRADPLRRRLGTQAWARRLRYRVFAEVAMDRAIPAVAVAHHADDQAETVLLALMRSGTLRAVAAMRPRRALDPVRAPGVALVRPLLATPRSEIHAYADAHGLAWRDDASNADRRHRRAVVRHDLLPHLIAVAPDIRARLAALADVAARAIARERRAVRRALTRAMPPGTHVLRLDALVGRPETVVDAVVRAALVRGLPGAVASTDRVAEVRALAGAQVGRSVVWAEGTVWRERDGLAFVPAREAAPDTPQTLDLGGRRVLTGGTARLALVPRPDAFPRDATRAWFDADALALPLTVRLWRAGDRIRPFGPGGARLVSDVLTDARVPASRRAAAPVAVDAAGRIVSVVGVRAGATAPVTAATRRVACLSWHPVSPDLSDPS